MNKVDLSQSANPDIRSSLAAMQRAAVMARKLAIDTNTAIVIVRDGEIVHISADELRREQEAESSGPDAGFTPPPE